MEFDIKKLSKADLAAYYALSPEEQHTYRDLWIRRQQEINRARMEVQRHRAAERKARTHRLIVRGAILESAIPETQELDDDSVSQLLRYARTTPYVQRYLLERKQGG